MNAAQGRAIGDITEVMTKTYQGCLLSSSTGRDGFTVELVCQLPDGHSILWEIGVKGGKKRKIDTRIRDSQAARLLKEQEEIDASEFKPSHKRQLGGLMSIEAIEAEIVNLEKTLETTPSSGYRNAIITEISQFKSLLGQRKAIAIAEVAFAIARGNNSNKLSI